MNNLFSKDRVHPPKPSESSQGTVGARYQWLIWHKEVFDNKDEVAKFYEKLLNRPPDRINQSDTFWWVGWISKQESRILHRHKVGEYE